MLNFWVLQSLSKLVFCWSSPPIWHFYLNASPLLWPRYISSYWRGRANNDLYCLHDRGYNLKNKQFHLREKESQNLYHSQYLDLFILRNAAAGYHSVYPDRKYLTCFSCEPSVFFLFCLTALLLFCPDAPFAGCCNTFFSFGISTPRWEHPINHEPARLYRLQLLHVLARPGPPDVPSVISVLRIATSAGVAVTVTFSIAQTFVF